MHSGREGWQAHWQHNSGDLHHTARAVSGATEQSAHLQALRPGTRQFLHTRQRACTHMQWIRSMGALRSSWSGRSRGGLLQTYTAGRVIAEHLMAGPYSTGHQLQAPVCKSVDQ